MRQKQTVYELTEDELQQEREAAASKAARLVTRDLRADIKSLERAIRLMRGVVFKTDLAHWFECDISTIERWNLPPMENHRGQRNLYWIPDVISHLRGVDDQEAQSVQQRLEEAFQNARDPLTDNRPA